MIVERHLYIAKMGRLDDALDHIRRQFSRNPWPNAARLYGSRVGSFNHIAIELESESLAAYEKTWKRWTTVAFTDKMTKEWHELTETGGHNEFWTVVDIQGNT